MAPDLEWFQLDIQLTLDPFPMQNALFDLYDYKNKLQNNNTFNESMIDSWIIERYDYVERCSRCALEFPTNHQFTMVGWPQ